MHARGLGIWLILWAATLGGAYLLGTQAISSDSDGATSDEPLDAAALQAENERLRRALDDRGPILESGVAGPRPTPTRDDGAGAEPGGHPQTLPGEAPVVAFNLDSAESADELLAQFLAYVKTMLARGESGHLELLKTFNDTLFTSKENLKTLERLFGDDDEAVRYIYPLIRFAVSNEAGVVGLTETTFKTMAHDPSKFEGFDDNTLEFFTEGVAYVLPGAVSEDRLATFRGYAKKILDTPEDQQPAAIRKNRRDIERILRVWAPRLAPEDAVARLRAGDVTPQEALALLAKLPPEMAADIDVAPWIGPLVAKGDYRAIRMLGRLRLTPRQLSDCDRHLLEGAQGRGVGDWTVRYYLQQTGRHSWAGARGLIEQGLNQGGRAVDVFAGCVMHLHEKPDADWVRWMLDTYTISEHVRKRLKSQFKID